MFVSLPFSLLVWGCQAESSEGGSVSSSLGFERAQRRLNFSHFGRSPAEVLAVAGSTSRLAHANRLCSRAPSLFACACDAHSTSNKGLPTTSSSAKKGFSHISLYRYAPRLWHYSVRHRHDLSSFMYLLLSLDGPLLGLLCRLYCKHVPTHQSA